MEVPHRKTEGVNRLNFKSVSETMRTVLLYGRRRLMSTSTNTVVGRDSFNLRKFTFRGIYLIWYSFVISPTCRISIGP